MTFENFKADSVTKEAYQQAQRLADEQGLLWLTMLGGVDLGKTHLAIAICRRWLESGKVARYAKSPTMIDELRAGFDMDGGETYQRRLSLFCRTPLLVIDDLGTERVTEFAREAIYTIIDYRYEHTLPLVVTLNKPIDDIPVDADCRIASRLQRFSQGKVVVIEGDEYRLRKKRGAR